MAFDKKRALSIVFSAADDYMANLANKSLLFLCIDKHYRVSSIETAFDESNFKHLTGLKSKLAPAQFFSMCLNRRLSERDFGFSPDGTTELKLRVLPKIVTSDLSARMVGRYNNSRPKLYTEVLAGGVNACLGFAQDGKSGLYVPNTLLNEDIRKLTTGTDRIALTLRKERSEADYAEVVYRAKNIDWDRVKLGLATKKSLQSMHGLRI